MKHDPLVAGAPDPALSPARQGAHDRALLVAALAEEDLSDKQRDAFSAMLDDVAESFGRFPHLTPRQRAWVLAVLQQRGRAVAVPRGAHVPLAVDAMRRPLAPPGRAKHIPPELCNAKAGGTAQDCLACGGACPHR